MVDREIKMLTQIDSRLKNKLCESESTMLTRTYLHLPLGGSIIRLSPPSYGKNIRTMSTRQCVRSFGKTLEAQQIRTTDIQVLLTSNVEVLLVWIKEVSYFSISLLILSTCRGSSCNVPSLQQEHRGIVKIPFISDKLIALRSESRFFAFDRRDMHGSVISRQGISDSSCKRLNFRGWSHAPAIRYHLRFLHSRRDCRPCTSA